MGLTLDIGGGNYPRGDVTIDTCFDWSNPYHHPEWFDRFSAPRHEDPCLVMCDANYPLPFRDESFERVIMVHVIEHLYRPYECLREIYRVLKNGGRLIIICPNAKKSQADWRDEGHYISFTLPTLKRLVSLVFQKVEVELIFGELNLYCTAFKEHTGTSQKEFEKHNGNTRHRDDEIRT